MTEKTRQNHTYEFFGLRDGEYVEFFQYSTNTPLEHMQIGGVAKLPARIDRASGATETWNITNICVIPVFNDAQQFTGQLTRILCTPRNVFD